MWTLIKCTCTIFFSTSHCFKHQQEQQQPQQQQQKQQSKAQQRCTR